MTAEVIGDIGRGRFGLEFHHDGDFNAQLDTLGEPPLPPYVRRQRDAEALDRERYQTVYAAHPGAIAAPTAGFHFTPELFAELCAQGNRARFVDAARRRRVLSSLYVSNEIENHRMEGERYSLNAAKPRQRSMRQKRRAGASSPSDRRARARWNGSRCKKARSLPTRASRDFTFGPAIRFRVIDALITNFHLPGSTPLILVAAFAGLDLVRRAYAEAIEQQLSVLQLWRCDADSLEIGLSAAALEAC